VIVISYNTSWYVYNFRRPLIRALKAAGFEVAVVAPRDEYTDRIIAEGVLYRDIRMEGKGKNPLREMATLLSFRRIYRELSPETILHYTIKPNLYGSLAARSLGIPAINNVTGLGEAFTRGGLLELVAKFLYRTAFAKVARVFFQNPDDQELFLREKLVRADQAVLLPGSGVDTARFAPLPRGEGPFTFLQVGRLLKAKGVEDFIAAARIVKKSRPETRFALLGRYDPEDSASADPEIVDTALKEGIVEHWGEADDVRPLIAKADCVVLPSYYREGTPRSLLEAAAMGKPLVAADSIGTREPVSVGVNGFLHKPRDSADLAEKLLTIRALSAEDIEAMGAASRRIMIERFEERIVLNAYLDAITRYRKERQGNK
jgi:glycosyltransferase involved in cell wall biosynthesis